MKVYSAAQIIASKAIFRVVNYKTDTKWLAQLMAQDLLSFLSRGLGEVETYPEAEIDRQTGILAAEDVLRKIGHDQKSVQFERYVAAATLFNSTDPDFLYIIGTAKIEPLGIIDLTRKTPTEAKLSGLFVGKRYRKFGIGTQLVDHIMFSAYDMGINKLYYEIEAKNHYGIDFLDRYFGFQKTYSDKQNDVITLSADVESYLRVPGSALFTGDTLLKELVERIVSLAEYRLFDFKTDSTLVAKILAEEVVDFLPGARGEVAEAVIQRELLSLTGENILTSFAQVQNLIPVSRYVVSYDKDTCKDALTIIGTIKMTPDSVIDLSQLSPVSATLADLVISKKYRNHGVGSKLVQYVLSAAAKMGINNVTYFVQSSNTSGMHFLKTLGFQEVAWDNKIGLTTLTRDPTPYLLGIKKKLDEGLVWNIVDRIFYRKFVYKTDAVKVAEILAEDYLSFLPGETRDIPEFVIQMQMRLLADGDHISEFGSLNEIIRFVAVAEEVPGSKEERISVLGTVKLAISCIDNELSEKTPLFAVMSELIVSKQFRYHGIGAAILEYGLLAARERGVSSITCQIRTHNEDGYYFLKKHGFEEMHENEKSGLMTLVKELVED